MHIVMVGTVHTADTPQRPLTFPVIPNALAGIPNASQPHLCICLMSGVLLAFCSHSDTEHLFPLLRRPGDRPGEVKQQSAYMIRIPAVLVCSLTAAFLFFTDSPRKVPRTARSRQEQLLPTITSHVYLAPLPSFAPSPGNLSHQDKR